MLLLFRHPWLGLPEFFSSFYSGSALNPHPSQVMNHGRELATYLRTYCPSLPGLRIAVTGNISWDLE